VSAPADEVVPADPDAETVVLTGARSGIGAGIAEQLAREGRHLLLVDRQESDAEWLSGLRSLSGGRVVYERVDLLRTAELPGLADRARSSAGRPWALVNCAGWDEIMPFAETTPALWADVIGINLTAVVALTHALWPDLARPGARLVNISSDAGRVGSLGETVYAGAKGGVIAFTKSVARELARHGATANCVSPGPVDTPFLAKNSDSLLAALTKAIPLRRLGTPADVAPAVSYFLSTGASYVTGQVLSVSGGLTMNG
jgi:2-hydroxycyclohexanecarboxyl-CoA dehydrogenase